MSDRAWEVGCNCRHGRVACKSRERCGGAVKGRRTAESLGARAHQVPMGAPDAPLAGTQVAGKRSWERARGCLGPGGRRCDLWEREGLGAKDARARAAEQRCGASRSACEREPDRKVGAGCVLGSERECWARLGQQRAPRGLESKASAEGVWGKAAPRVLGGKSDAGVLVPSEERARRCEMLKGG